jgi:hypothetical protein
MVEAMAVIMAVAMVEATVVIMAVAMAEATAVVILRLIVLTLIKLRAQKVGKIEALEIILKTLNLKVEEAEEKEEFQMKTIYLKKKINIPFL